MVDGVKVCLGGDERRVRTNEADGQEERAVSELLKRRDGVVGNLIVGEIGGRSSGGGVRPVVAFPLRFTSRLVVGIVRLLGLDEDFIVLVERGPQFDVEFRLGVRHMKDLADAPRCVAVIFEVLRQRHDIGKSCA